MKMTYASTNYAIFLHTKWLRDVPKNVLNFFLIVDINNLYFLQKIAGVPLSIYSLSVVKPILRGDGW